MTPAIVWLRRDLRLTDHPALWHLCQQNRPVLLVYIHDDSVGRPIGGAASWWLHHSLASLEQDVQRLGGQLVLRQGNRLQHLQQIAAACGATEIHCLRHWTPDEHASEHALAQALPRHGLSLHTHHADLLYEPGHIRTGKGGPFQVFTPFWRAACALPPPASPLPRPDRLPGPQTKVDSLPLDSLSLLPRIAWWHGIAAQWHPGEATAQRRLSLFIQQSVQHYAERRDRPDQDATSRLSPHLAWGEISPRQIWAALDHCPPSPGTDCFRRELGWREFSHHLLCAFPNMETQPLRPEFSRFPWRDDPQDFTLWCQGKTGFPIVDAGMQQLWHSGWMHNRVRMIVGSFLVKDLRLPWQWGEEWFWDCLVDASPAINPVSWQWVAGCGADAAPYFRIFNPHKQAETFDPKGDYCRRWLPEMGRARPMLDHAKARAAALQAYASLKDEAQQQPEKYGELGL